MEGQLDSEEVRQQSACNIPSATSLGEALTYLSLPVILNHKKRKGGTAMHYVMSDIHGQYEAYTDILEQINLRDFSKKDKLYILGDVIDRGEHSLKILQHIMENQDKICLLMGNHEKMMLQALPDPRIQNLTSEEVRLWRYNGGSSTCTEFTLLSIPERKELLDFLQNLPYRKIIQGNKQKYYLVHGMPYGGVNRSHSTQSMSKREQMLWGTFDSFDKNHLTVVFGHRCTVQYDEEFRTALELPEHFRIIEKDNYIAIDCGCAYQNTLSRLGCIRLEDRQCFYGKLAKVDPTPFW